MYFILSKVLLIFLFPLTWVFALLVAAFIIKKTKLKQRVLLWAVILLYVFSNAFLLNQFAKVWNVAAPPQTPAVYSCAIVLGGFSDDDGKGNGYFNGSADRFIQGIKLLTNGKVKHLLITSGNGGLLPDSFREGTWVKTQLEQLKFPDSAILIESNSRNTIENAEFSKVVLQHTALKPPYLLITSAFHMRRSMMIFQHRGYDVVPYPCNYMQGYGRFNLGDLLPSADALAGWCIYLKEVVGYAVDYFK